MAAVIDGAFLWAAYLVPAIGVVVALVYGFTNDAWPLLGGLVDPTPC
ncbi:MAG: hypothetical protein HZB55_22820 [Deltaproteobacteria bacterium]|nr:hypothetical protein [Deltaproteobacteria bacterium]